MSLLLHDYDRPLAVLPMGFQGGPERVQTLLHSVGLWTMITCEVPCPQCPQESCACPHMVEGACQCHELVMLVYGAGEAPVTLILQCRGLWTCVYLSEGSPGQANPAAKNRLVDVLVTQDEEGA